MNRVYGINWCVLSYSEVIPLSPSYDSRNSGRVAPEVGMVTVSSDGTNVLALVVSTNWVVEGFMQTSSNSPGLALSR